MKQVKLHLAGVQYGPFVCPDGAEIADRVHKLVNLHPQALQDEPSFSIALPKLTSPHYVVVLVQPTAADVESTSNESAESLLQDAYIVEMEEEATSLQFGEIANRLRDVYGPNVYDKGSLRAHNGAYNKGSTTRVLVATRSRRQQPIKPPTNQPVVEPSEESPPLSPTMRNGPAAAGFVYPTQGKQPWEDNKLSTLRSFNSQRGTEESLATYKRTSSPFRDGVEAERRTTTNVESEDSQQLELEQVPPQGEKDSTNEGEVEEADNSLSQGHQDHDESYVQHQVHLLEHVYNGQCFTKDNCKKVPTQESRREMERVISAHEKGQLDVETTEKLKGYIVAHCLRCDDSKCRIPHVAAGCLPPGQVCSSTEERDDSSASSEGSLIHLLEHAYNDKCYKMDKCQQPPSAGDLQQFVDMIKRYDKGRLDPDSTKLLKSYILKHCQRCNDVGCKVPHMAAGCHQPGMPMVEKDSGASKQPSRKDVLMEKVHALEHVYNGKCILQKCKKLPSSEVTRAIEGMKQAYEEGKLNPQLSKQLKRVIYAHCLRCSDVDCKVPHMMAGCQHPRVPQHLDPWAYRFTDGKKEIAQPTEKDGLSAAYPYYRKPKPDVPSTDQEEICEATDSHIDEGKQESQELVLKNGCFPKKDVLQQHSELRGQQRLLYCSQKLTELTGLEFGSSLAEVDMTRSSHKLGRGGNGNVHECIISGQKFASKQTFYRPKELTIWSGLDHNNVTPLLGVVTSASRLLGYSRSIPIYQLMPSMTGDFQKEVNRFGTLQSLIHSQKNPANIAHVLKNTYHVFREAAAGIAYMHDNQLVHGDLKASNILILRPPTCCCAHVLLCTCKYRVLVSDFDSSVDQSDHNKTNHCIKDRIVVLHLGTPFYRAPELHTNMVGPWCDMWSVGCTLAHLILGHDSTKVKMKRYGITKLKDVYKYHDIPHFAMILEASDALGMLDSLCETSGADSDADISRLIEVVDGCFHLDYARRITAKALHDKFSSCMKL